MTKERQVEIIFELQQLCEELGWSVAIPSGEEMVPGLIIGEEAFVIAVASTYYGEDFEVFEKNEETEKMEPVEVVLPNGKKTQVH